MIVKTLQTRYFSKKNKLTKRVREIYLHRNINFFPAGFTFARPVLILSREIYLFYSTVLLADCYEFVVCSCSLQENDQQVIEELRETTVWIRDELMEELADGDEMDRLEGVLEYLRASHPHGRFDILTENNIEEYCREKPFEDVALSRREIDRTTGKRRITAGTLVQIQEGVGVVRPIDRRISDITVRTGLGRRDLHRKVLVHVSGTEGTIYKVLGQNGNMEDEIEAILEHYGVEYGQGWDGFAGDFTVEEAKRETKEGRRRDLRGLEIFSVDPPGCTDVDDALHCEDHGEYVEVGVHIADVSHYVRPGTALDREAQRRSATLYLPHRRIDMLPPVLSSNLCSLVEGEERAAVSCIWKLDREFKVVGTEVCRTLIRSRAAVSYETAQAMVEGGTDGMAEALRMLVKIAKKYRQERFERGALELNVPKISVSEHGEVEQPRAVETYAMVEEFMLLANTSVARLIYEYNPEYSLLRRHPQPDKIDLDAVDATGSKALSESLKRLEPERAVVVRRLITRSLRQAVYFCSGESADFYHYGLATEIYTHFTSPIRRYPDIIVHRALEYIFEDRAGEMTEMKAWVDRRACRWMNRCVRGANRVAWAVGDLFVLLAVKEGEYDATVINTKNEIVTVFISEYGIEGEVKTSKKCKMFDVVRVRIRKDFEEFCINRKYELTAV